MDVFVARQPIFDRNKKIDFRLTPLEKIEEMILSLKKYSTFISRPLPGLIYLNDLYVSRNSPHHTIS
jgi:hypothetical protein